jgi:hypothetical protein
MYEAFMLFESICNSKWFINTSMILFLNKLDLFQQKIHKSNISEYFPDYKGKKNIHILYNNDRIIIIFIWVTFLIIGPPTDFNQAKDFFRHRFTKLNSNPNKQVYVHYTVATDTKLLAHVMESVSDSILHENLQTFLL